MQNLIMQSLQNLGIEKSLILSERTSLQFVPLIKPVGNNSLIIQYKYI